MAKFIWYNESKARQERSREYRMKRKMTLAEERQLARGYVWSPGDNNFVTINRALKQQRWQQAKKKRMEEERAGKVNSSE